VVGILNRKLDRICWSVFDRLESTVVNRDQPDFFESSVINRENHISHLDSLKSKEESQFNKNTLIVFI